MRSGGGIDQLNADPYSRPGLANAAIEDEPCVKPLADLSEISRLLNPRRGAGGDDDQVAELRQAGRDLFGQPLGEGLEFRVASAYLER